MSRIPNFDPKMTPKKREVIFNSTVCKGVAPYSKSRPWNAVAGSQALAAGCTLLDYEEAGISFPAVYPFVVDLERPTTWAAVAAAAPAPCDSACAIDAAAQEACVCRQREL